MKHTRQSIAVVGGGVAGIVCAHLLAKKHEVVLFEANDYLGGHTNTFRIEEGVDAGLGVDTGFIVLNDKNYPLFHRFLKELEVEVRWSDMSFGFYDELTDFQYAGTTLNGLFAQRRNIVSKEFWRFLLDLFQFCTHARRDLTGGFDADITLGEYIQRRKTPVFLVQNYLLPMGAAIWSAPFDEILSFPAQHFLAFFQNHGLLSFRNRPRWQTVCGGSSSYVQRFQELFPGSIRLNTPVKRVSRQETGVKLHFEEAPAEEFSHVVCAGHADQMLAILDEPSEMEKALLGSWSYQSNRVVLHSDIRLLPPLQRAWASWNYMRYQSTTDSSGVQVSYWMNLLQGISSETQYIVTLNNEREIETEKQIATFHYTHPVYSQSAIATQAHLPKLNGVRRTSFCGSYFGYGFHEDAVRSAVRLAQQWDCELGA